ncbi:unnamed protein product [Prunus armeniaca]
MAEAFKFKLLLQSTPYYAQANGQAESNSSPVSQNCSSTQSGYSQAMLLELEGLDASRIDTLNKLLAGKQAVSRAYNKIVKNKSFEEGEIILGMGAYRLQDQDGVVHAGPINGKWLKKFYPTMWDSQVVQTDPRIENEQD